MILTAALGAVSIFVVGCDEEDFVLRFSHSTHVKDNEMACTDCHGELGAALKTPDHDVCTQCHQEIVEADKISKETCGTCHVEKDLETIGETEAKKPPAKGIFIHTKDLEGRCDKCHGDLLNEKAERIPVLTKKDITAMRTRGHALSLPCVTCHVDLDQRTKPETHQRDWKRLHGVLSLAEEGTTCDMCHTKESCAECHQSEQPSYHTNLFRLKTHGMQGSWDRQRCRTCHQDDFCASCHKDTKPRSHGAGWQSRHCANCHTDTDPNSGCQTCHEGGIEVHDMTPPIWHRDVHVSCLTVGCHAPGTGGPRSLIPLKHPFLDETECSICHRL